MNPLWGNIKRPEEMAKRTNVWEVSQKLQPAAGRPLPSWVAANQP
jgi:hypothetical protein